MNGDINKNFKIDPLNTNIGLSFDQYILDNYQNLDNNSNNLTKLYTNIYYALSKKYYQKIGLMLLLINNKSPEQPFHSFQLYSKT